MTAPSETAALDQHLAVAVNRLLATPTELENWLLTLPPGAVVGTAQDACGCVVSKFLRSQGIPVLAAFEDLIELPDGGRVYPQPWLSAFIRELDLAAESEVLDGDNAVTRETALTVLAAVNAELAAQKAA